MRRVSERDEKQRRRLCVSVVYDRNVCVESFGCDDMHVLSSWHLRQRIERDCMRSMRSRSLRDIGSIVFVRTMLAWHVRLVRGIEHVHGVRSRKVRTE